MVTFDDLRRANAARQKEWCEGEEELLDLSFKGNELAGEVGEACNNIKKLERGRLGLRGAGSSPSEVVEELADAVICIDLIAMKLGFDLGDAVRNKFDETSEEYGLGTRFIHHMYTPPDDEP